MLPSRSSNCRAIGRGVYSYEYVDDGLGVGIVVGCSSRCCADSAEPPVIRAALIACARLRTSIPSAPPSDPRAALALSSLSGAVVLLVLILVRSTRTRIHTLLARASSGALL